MTTLKQQLLNYFNKTIGELERFNQALSTQNDIGIDEARRNLSEVNKNTPTFLQDEGMIDIESLDTIL